MRADDPVAAGNLQVFPLQSPTCDEPAYALFDELIERGEVDVGEIHGGGHVPTIRLRNRSDRDAFLLDGTELRGAKQNRMVNVSILAARHATTDIPVTCVEAGRWAYRAGRFASTKRTVASKLRRAKAHHVSHGFAAFGAPAADQGAVWSAVDTYLHRAGVESATSSLDDAFTQRTEHIDNLVARLRDIAAHGALVAVGGEIVALDLFDHAETFGKLWESLLRGYAMDALLEVSTKPRTTTRAAVSQWLHEVRTVATLEPHVVPGVGRYWAVRGPSLAGGLVAHGGRVIHTAIFSATANEAWPQ